VSKIKAQLIKDWVALWPLLVGFWALLILAVVDCRTLILVDSISLTLIIEAMAILLAGILFLQDNCTTPNAFWKTYPISSWQLVFSKLVLVFTLVFTPALLAQFICMLGFQLDLIEIISALLQSFSWLLTLACIGSLATLISHRLSTWLLCVVIISPILFISTHFLASLLQPYSQNILTLLIRCSFFLAISLSAAVLFWRYQSNHYKKGLFAIIFCGTLLACSHSFARIYFYEHVSSLATKSAKIISANQQQTPEISLVRHQTCIQIDCLNNPLGYKNRIVLKVKNILPNIRLHFTELNAEWKSPDGTMIRSRYKLRGKNDIAINLQARPREIVFGKAAAPSYQIYEINAPKLIEDIHMLNERTQQLKMDIQYSALRYDTGAVMPTTTTGWVSGDGKNLYRLIDFENSDESTSIKIGWRSFGFYSHDHTYTTTLGILLRNPEKKETISQWSFPTNKLNKRNAVIRYPKINYLKATFQPTKKNQYSDTKRQRLNPKVYQESPLPLTENWIKEAEILPVMKVLIGQFSQPIHMDFSSNNPELNDL